MHTRPGYVGDSCVANCGPGDVRLSLLLLVSRAILVIRVCLLQLLRAIAFLNKHGFATLYINRENIVLQMVLGNDKLVSIS